MQDLKYILKKRINERGLRQQVDTAQLLDSCNKIIYREFGDFVRDQAQAAYIKNRVLYVAVLSAPLAQEIGFRKKAIYNELKAQYKHMPVDRIRCVTA